MLNTIMLMMILLPWQALLATAYRSSEIEQIPLAQVRIENFTDLYAEPSIRADISGRVRPHDVVWLYQIEGEWGRSDGGWLPLAGLRLTPAVVHFSAVLTENVDIAPNSTIGAHNTVGVLALFEDQALIYTRDAFGWTAKSGLELIAPTPELLNFVERLAYVKVESAALYAQPDGNDPSTSIQPLGEAVSLVFQEGEWILVRAGGVYGWSLASNFDAALLGQAYGEMNRGPINVRQSPVDGKVIAVLGYREQVVVLAQNEAGDWLYIRLMKGTEGWVASEFVDIEQSGNDLPLLDIREN